MPDTAAYVGFATLVVFFYYLQKITTANRSREEPPLLKPRVPWIGHIIGLLRHEASYFSVLRARANAPAITMFMLNEKTYVLFSPYLAQQAMRHRSLDFTPVALGFNKSVANISDKGMAISVSQGPGTYTTETMGAIRTGLMGEGLYRTNNALLAYIGSQLNAIPAGDEGLHVPSFWLWMRDMVTMATTEAIYGQANPFRADPAGLDAVWDFDDAVQSMLMMPAPLARAGARHRDRVVRTMRPYFEARLDRNDDVSRFVALPTESSIKHNWVGDDLCKNAVMSLWASTSNSIPALFWTVTNVWLRPGLAERVREEVIPLVVFSQQNGRRKATLNIRQVEKQCPLLLSCQRECLRSKGHMIARRAVKADTMLTGEDGTTYLLKKGGNVMWSANVTHQLPDVWGADSHDFDPERFVKETDKETEKKRRAAYVPFGGGMHLCPGRHLALDEILGFTSALVLGYEIEGLFDDKVKVGRQRLANGIAKPAEDGDGGPVTLRRRKSWEDVQWSFECFP